MININNKYILIPTLKSISKFIHKIFWSASGFSNWFAIRVNLKEKVLVWNEQNS